MRGLQSLRRSRRIVFGARFEPDDSADGFFVPTEIEGPVFVTNAKSVGPERILAGGHRRGPAAGCFAAE